MGFWIDVDADDARLLSLLRSNPSEVFDRPYSGYLLFLAGAADQEIVNWISQNLAALDSLTGDDIAFAIFARRFPMTLKTSEKRISTPPTSSIHTAPLEEVRDAYSVTRLCKSGVFGQIVDGDVLTAITYAVDDIARGFGVLGDLPCMIVLDGIPNEKFDVLPLNARTTEKLIPLLRKAIARFRRARSFEAYGQSVRQIVTLLDSLSTLNKRRNADILRLEVFGNETSARVRTEVTNVSNARNDLLNGELEGLRRRLHNTRLLDAGQAEAISDLVNQKHATLIQYSRTTAALRRLVDKAKWPLNAERSKQYETCHEYARLLLGMAPSALSCESPDQCLQVLSLLEESQQRIVDEILKGIPNEDTLKSRAIENRSTELKILEAQLASYSVIDETRKQELIAATQALNSLDHPTISKVFAKLAREERLMTIRGAIKENAAVFAGSIFKPEMLLKIWGAIT